MKTAGSSLVTYLTSGRRFARAELWTFTLATGQLARYTPLDRSVTVGGHTWAARGPVLERDRSRQVAGVSVDDFTVTVKPRQTDLLAGIPWVQAARRGLLRGGRVLIERMYFPVTAGTPAWSDTSLGKLYHMGGRIADTTGTGAEVRCVVRSDLELLNVQIPRQVVQPSCVHTLFDEGCGLDRDAFDVAGAITSSSTASVINCSLSGSAEYFTRGRIEFLTGPNAGATRAVKRWSGGQLTLALPLFAAPTVGDTFTAWPGCDKTPTTCQNRFANRVNFLGMPTVPRPEVAL